MAWIDTVVFDDLGEDEFGVIHSGFFIAPPSELVAFSIKADEGEVEPEGVPSGESVAEGGVFNFSSGAGGGGFVAGVFDNERVAEVLFFPGRIPVFGEVEGVVDLGVFIIGRGDGDALTRCG